MFRLINVEISKRKNKWSEMKTILSERRHVCKLFEIIGRFEFGNENKNKQVYRTKIKCWNLISKLKCDLKRVDSLWLTLAGIMKLPCFTCDRSEHACLLLAGSCIEGLESAYQREILSSCSNNVDGTYQLRQLLLLTLFK